MPVPTNVRMFFFVLAVLALMAAVASAEDELVSTAALNLEEPAPQPSGITQLPDGPEGETCFLVDQKVVQELGDGGIFLDVLGPAFDVMTLVLGSDQRQILGIIMGSTDYHVCFKAELGYDEDGMPKPVVRGGYFIPPDLSS